MDSLFEIVDSIPYWLLVLVGGIALFGAFQFYYWGGKKLGAKLPETRVGRKIGKERIAKVENLVRRWGALSVFGCFWVPGGLRHTLPWVAGALQVNYRWYLVASAVGCVTWVPVTAFGLYAGVWAWLKLAATSPLYGGLTLAALIAVVVLLVWRRRRRANAPAARENEPAEV
ncbi:VTT domain-containing protein [Acrocarpospora sp. B8E8]|uniref:DedA family protein n=1 Tax=Acrocarpospora sp. B8E8 TaxID=3153572 RepID=UPI00325DF27B